VVKVGSSRVLTITAPGASDDNRYIQRVRLDGSNLAKTWVRWSDVARGGTLAHTLGSRPSKWGTSVEAQPPSINQARGDDRTHVDATVRPLSAAVPASSAAQQVKLSVDVVGQAPGLIAPRVRVSTPAGWTATTTRIRPMASRRLPVSATATVTVLVAAGASLGPYEIGVEVSAPGANTVTTTASVSVREPTTCVTPGPNCAVELGRERTVDGTATVAAPAEGNFDGGGWSYDADLLPAAGPVTWDGVTYAAPDPAGTAKNFVSAHGQAVLLPPGEHTAVKLVATAYNGPATAGLTIGYADGTSSDATIVVADWCGTATAGTTNVLAMPHRIKAGQGIDGPPVSLFGLSLPIPAGKQIRSITLPNDPRLNLYAITLT
jgi:hypothetical protein